MLDLRFSGKLKQALQASRQSSLKALRAVSAAAMAFRAEMEDRCHLDRCFLRADPFELGIQGENSGMACTDVRKTRQVENSVMAYTDVPKSRH